MADEVNGSKPIAITLGLGAIVTTIFAIWISSVSAHGDKPFHEGVHAVIQEYARTEHTWNESQNWKQEERFKSQSSELRVEITLLRTELAEVKTLMRVLEERSRPENK